MDDGNRVVDVKVLRSDEVAKSITAEDLVDMSFRAWRGPLAKAITVRSTMRANRGLEDDTMKWLSGVFGALVVATMKVKGRSLKRRGKQR